MKATREESTPQTLTLSELLRLSGPLTGASSLSHSRPIKPQSPPISLKILFPTQNPNPNPRTLKSLNHPTIISGTLILPSPVTSPPPFSLQFSDGALTVPCDVLDFDVRAIGTKIHVTAWNFIPFKSGNGFLEIISWEFSNSHQGLSISDVFPLSNGNLISSVNDAKARYSVHGVLKSASPVSLVPCSRGPNCKDSANICGFLVNVLACECKLCKKNELVMDSAKNHNFTASVILYFCGNYASSWHPVIVKLIGSIVSLSRLKKKLVFIGEQQSELMYVTTENTSICILKLHEKRAPVSKNVIKGKGECGSYSGTVTDIYLNGMVVELDQKVMLVVTDQQLVLPHSVRLGAMVSVRSVHFVNPKFSWIKILILGACFKTSICLESFSPFETGCCMYRQSQSLLGKFIDSLVYSARVWVLLLVSSFRKKFDGILSEHEILGSKHKKGLVQSYAASHLPLSVFQSRHGLFMEYCKHDSCCCSKEPSGVQLKMVVPISKFITDCSDMWVKRLSESDADSEVTYVGEKKSSFFCEGVHYSQPNRRVLGGNEIGVALIGQAMISPSSGRLLLTDATGSTDVLVTDLPSTWSVNSIHEVNDFSVVMGGVPEQGKQAAMYILCHFRDTKSLNHPYNSTLEDNRICELQSGSFHILLVTHKYPFSQKFQGDQDMSNCSSVFAEAFLLPWDINFLGKNDDGNPTKLFAQGLIRSKRLKTDQRLSSYGLHRCTELGSLPDIPCSVTYRGIDNQLLSSTAAICSSNSDIKVSSGKAPRAQKLLLEFKSESFYKYQLLNVGGYYIIQHHKEDGLCSNNTIGHTKLCKITISSKIHLWSSSFSSNQVYPNENECDLPISVGPTNETFDKCRLKNEQLFPRHSCEFSKTQSDVTIHLSNDDLEFLKGNLKRMDMSLIKPFVSLEEIPNLSCSNKTNGLLQSPVYSASDYKLPEGNLISLHAEVLSVHTCKSNEISILGNDSRRVKIFQAAKSVCIHILADHHPIRIFGAYGNHVYPVGFGPGCSADFHRILILRGQNKLVMTPSSYIEIKSIRLTAVRKNGDDNKLSVPSDCSGDVSLDTIPSALISETMQPVGCKLLQFHCRVVAILILSMEKNRKAACHYTSSHTRSTVFQIPLAGFILDDGSSTSCFWANNEMAIQLLRLNEQVPHEMATREVDSNTAINLVDKIVKKHDFISVRNYGSIYDSTGQDLTLSVASNCVINNSDEEFLKRLFLHACTDTSWIVVGSMMDLHGVAKLEKQLAEMDMPMHRMQNVWVHDVRHIDPLAKARKVMRDLLN